MIALGAAREALPQSPVPPVTEQGGPGLASSAVLPWDQRLQKCVFGQLASPARLADIVERAICNSPKAWQAWAKKQEQMGHLGLARTELLPTLAFTYEIDRGYSSTSVTDAHIYDFSSPTSTSQFGFNLEWILFDFGKRSADRAGARQQLIVAMANEDEAIRNVFLDAVRTYYDLQSARSALEARQAAERTAREVVSVASQKYTKGIVPLSDTLQAQTTYVQSQLDRVKAEGDVTLARASLGNTMGVAADDSLEIAALPPIDPDADRLESLTRMIELARSSHPQLVAARASVQAAVATEAGAASTGLPTISVVGTWSRSDHYPTSQFLVKQGTLSNDRSIGLRVSVPLLTGPERAYQIDIARAQAVASEQDLRQAELSVMLEVEKSYQSLLTAAKTLRMSRDLAGNARRSYDFVAGRYQRGVGSIVDLLNAESALANAEQQRVQAVSNWLSARLNLDASVGQFTLALLSPD